MTDVGQQGDQVVAPTATQSTELRAARIRWAAYVLLITLSVGNMAGRILSVTNVDIQAIEKMRVRQAVARHKAHWEKEGFRGKPLQEKLDRYEVEVRERVNLQRPFLSANDRSRWCTIRALVDDGTYAIDQIVTDPKEYSGFVLVDFGTIPRRRFAQEAACPPKFRAKRTCFSNFGPKRSEG